MMVKRLVMALGVVVFALTPSVANAAGQRIFLEDNVDRYGADFREFEVVRNGGPAVCHQECKNDGQCRSWTYVRPGVEGLQGKCKLKNSIPTGSTSPCCISGVVVSADAEPPVYYGRKASLPNSENVHRSSGRTNNGSRETNGAFFSAASNSSGSFGFSSASYNSKPAENVIDLSEIASGDPFVITPNW